MRKIIFDCDPGVDDATALFLAFAAQDRLDILGITTVAGNVGPQFTARNACIIRQMAGVTDVPVYAGCGKPLVRQPVEAGDFHGESGLGPLPIFATKMGVESAHAVTFIIDTLMQSAPNEISVVITGPCTNLAAAIAMEPRIAARIREIVIMGGARTEGGNITASAEFNIFADPHAAASVLACGAPIVMFGLDATHQVRTSPARIAAFRKAGTRVTMAIADLFTFSSAIEHGLPDNPGAPLHDPCTIVYLLEPSLFQHEPCHIAVETSGTVALGHTSVEFRQRANQSFNAKWAVRSDAHAIFEMILTRTMRL